MGVSKITSRNLLHWLLQPSFCHCDILYICRADRLFAAIRKMMPLIQWLDNISSVLAAVHHFTRGQLCVVLHEKQNHSFFCNLAASLNFWSLHCMNLLSRPQHLWIALAYVNICAVFILLAHLYFVTFCSTRVYLNCWSFEWFCWYESIIINFNCRSFLSRATMCKHKTALPDSACSQAVLKIDVYE